MKKTIGMFVVLPFVLVGIIYLNAGECLSSENAPTVEVLGPVKMSKNAKVTIKGKGFKSGQEISILFTDKDGIQSDIGYALKPAPKADASGSWTTTWSCGRFISKKLVKAGGPHEITVTDSEYSPLAYASVSFIKAEKK